MDENRGFRDFGRDILDAAGPIDGGRIVLNALPSPITEVPAGRWVQILIDDNNAPGDDTLLDLHTTQSAADLQVAVGRGGIVEISVETMDPVFGFVKGTLRLLMPIMPGGAPAPPFPDGVRFHEELKAIVTVVEDREGRTVYCHVLCLEADGEKSSAAEKQRRLLKRRSFACELNLHIPHRRPRNF
jgi:hypothetical protein